MRLSFLLLSITLVILAVQATDEVATRLRSEGDVRSLKEKNTGTTTKLSAADLTTEERGGLIAWMMFQNGKSKKVLERLESMDKVERMGRHRIIKPFNIDDIDETKIKAVVEKVAAAKKKASTS
ncbi:hypothetical protein P3T76_015246 [Phytophthora citrophthora]|uniref:RxLR effector protein n=1 Tax=Phytophthora citrophthora TaxID=4793 RepID=A0AAD9FZP2_9STRA|nr:hypothetical protein P3T76_015246 [Phytophthora citrophthora]